MQIQPVRNDADHQAALAEIETLFSARPGTSEDDRLDVLVTLVETYEARHMPIAAPDPVATIEYILESCGLTQRDLAPYIGSRARVSEMLNRRQSLTLEMIRKLHQSLGVPAEVLIQLYDLHHKAA